MSDITEWLEQRRALETQATEGPWEECWVTSGKDASSHCALSAFRGDTEVIVAEAEGVDPRDSMDMEFIAVSRNDYAALLDVVEALAGIDAWESTRKCPCRKPGPAPEKCPDCGATSDGMCPRYPYIPKELQDQHDKALSALVQP